MKNFFKYLIALFSANNATTSLEDKLEKAVKADDVQAAYNLLAQGADVNTKIFFEAIEYVDSYDYRTVTRKTCLLEIAKSEPMRRLLLHYGALPLDELKKRWKEEEQRKEEMKREQRVKEQAEKQRQLDEKVAADNTFLDNVLKD